MVTYSLDKPVKLFEPPLPLCKMEVWSILIPRGCSVTCVPLYKMLSGYFHCSYAKKLELEKRPRLAQDNADDWQQGRVDGKGGGLEGLRDAVSHIRTYLALLHCFSLLASSSIPDPLLQFLICFSLFLRRVLIHKLPALGSFNPNCLKVWAQRWIRGPWGW